MYSNSRRAVQHFGRSQRAICNRTACDQDHAIGQQAQPIIARRAVETRSAMRSAWPIVGYFSVPSESINRTADDHAIAGNVG
jgi:hypothetical protein